ncbi:hypothetical protein LIER_06238 [Lithospermum erythrorhizon]|uniref:Uncharacterized protein n=1 Tax=Lithospermum erythrorhizon TaxID=34254 RepID=A0AAV3P8B0_LITER
MADNPEDETRLLPHHIESTTQPTLHVPIPSLQLGGDLYISCKGTDTAQSPERSIITSSLQDYRSQMISSIYDAGLSFMESLL